MRIRAPPSSARARSSWRPNPTPCGAIAGEYLRREGPRLRTFVQRKSDLDLLCASVLGRQPVAEITRGQYTRVLDHIADNNGPVRSDRCLSALRTLLSWHSARSDFISPLVRGGRRTSIAERARSRILTDEELRRGLAGGRAGQRPLRRLRAVHVVDRRRDVARAAGLRRSELSDGGTIWTIPGVRYKSGKDTVIPLSAAAQAIIAAQPVLPGGDFVFSSDGSRPLGDFASRKAALDKVAGVSGYSAARLAKNEQNAVEPRRYQLPTLPKCASAMRWAACAGPMTASHISIKNVKPSKRWRR